jgi:hypothetical protein
MMVASSSARLILERLAVVVAHHVAGSFFFDRPGRREAARPDIIILLPDCFPALILGKQISPKILALLEY